jgi:hypothetical protein
MTVARLLRLPALFAVCLGTAQAALRPPYTADSATAYLFHFEDTAGSTTAINHGTAAKKAIAYSAATYPGDGVAVTAGTTILAGTASSSGFGQAASLSNANQGLGFDADNLNTFVLDDGAPVSADRLADHSSMLGAGNTFTIEALVRLNTALGGNRQIICTDSGEASNANRGFQFRFNNSNLEFNWIGKASGTAGVTVAVPTTGAEAFAINTWFHVALAYDGTTLRFYWTRLDAARTSATLLHTVTTDIDATDDMQLVLGNEARAVGTTGSTEGLNGLLDQVRISTVARSASEFVFTTSDSDSDGLPDEWELLYFGNLAQDAAGDPDTDNLTNLAEFQSGSNPAFFTNPLDLDADGLPDSWEQRYFGSLSLSATADTDGDGATNAAEFSAGSAPNNRASTSADTDADGLPDSWEQTHFSTLTFNAGDDPDGDRFANLQELTASTSPADPISRPVGTAVKLVPVDDGNHATSEFGYAGESAINSVAFVRCSLQTFGNQQFMTWYGRHQFDASAAFNNTLWIGRRTIGASQWEVFKHPTFTANTITDGHDVISFGIDGDGYMHLSWGMHGDAFHYSKSTTPVNGTGPIVLGPDTTMVGHETIVTYPQFLRLPDGDLLYLFRRFYSGNGAQFLNRYSVATRTWRAVHTDSNGAAVPFLSGMWAPAYDYNPYVNMPQLGGADGRTLTLTFNWRYLPVNGSGAPGSPGGFSGYQTNNNLNYARSTDAGLTWLKANGTPYALPITRNADNGVEASRAELIQSIPEGYSLINQASMCLDSNGWPVTATWWAPETGATNYRRQYMVVFRHDNGTWQARSVSSRITDPTTVRYAENHVRDLGRPTVVRDDADRIIVAYRDNQASNLSNADNSLNSGVSNGITIVHSLPRTEDPDHLLWISFDLTGENLGNYETMIDNELWDQKRQLHFLYQPSGGQGYTAPANTASRISVLEWDAADYFTHSPQPGIETINNGAGVRIHWRSEPSFAYRLYTSTDLIDWTVVETRTGTGAQFEFRHTFAPGEPKRFWRLHRAEGSF